MASMQPTVTRTRSLEATLATNKLIRNTYTLLAMTLAFSAVTAGLSVFLRIPPMAYLLCVGGALLLIWFVLPRTANSASGLGVVFAITGLLGFGLGPILTAYLALSNGPQIVATAFGGTAAIFLGLSGYALVTRKDFSFMAGFLMTGLLVLLVAMLANIFLTIPALSLTIAAAFMFLMSGVILFNTSQMVHNPEANNYIEMTVSLYLAIFNIFISLLQLLGLAGGDD